MRIRVPNIFGCCENNRFSTWLRLNLSTEISYTRGDATTRLAVRLRRSTARCAAAGSLLQGIPDSDRHRNAGR
jgi:hypothetical protein